MLKDYISEKGMSPTLRELKDILGVKYLKSATQFLDSLEEKGYLTRTPNQARGIQLLNRMTDGVPGTMTVPVIGSAGCDNLSVFAEPTYDDYVSLDKSIISSLGRTVGKLYAIKAIGKSMESSGISDGDYVLVEVTEDVKSNDRVAAIVGGMAVIKRIQFGEDAVILNPDSPDNSYKPIILKEKPDIIGKVLSVIRTQPDDIEYFPEI